MEDPKFEEVLKEFLESTNPDHKDKVTIWLLLKAIKTAKAYVDLFFNLFTRLVIAQETQAETFKGMY